MKGHLDRKRILELLSTSRRSRRDPDLDDILEHLFEKCEHCRSELEQLTHGWNSTSCPTSMPSELLVSSSSSPACWARAKAEALVLATELAALPCGHRRAAVLGASDGTCSPELVDLLLGEARAQFSKNPYEALEFADCARNLASRPPRRDVPASVVVANLARTDAYRANALRISGVALRQVELILDSALKQFDEGGTGDPVVQGELMEIHAALYRDQRRFMEAEACLDIAIGFYSEIQEMQLLSRAVLVKATAQHDAGELEKALDEVARALRTIDPRAEPHLYFCAVHNSIDCLADLGRFTEAEHALEENASLYHLYQDPATQLKRLWIEAKITDGRGKNVRAKRMLRKVRDGFTELGFERSAMVADQQRTRATPVAQRA